MAGDDWFPRSGPRRKNADGVAAKKKSGAIGDTWWSKRFVTVLEGVTAGSRLARGKTYARSGQVSHLEVAPGVVTARVQGSRPQPYRVRISLAAVSDAEWAVVETALASQALFAAALLGGDMPHEIEQVFSEAGAPLFPTRPGELETTCSCPDHANPCKHVAATYYLLAEHFDADPFAILAWRGRDREALVAALRVRRTVDDGPAVASTAPDPPSTDLGTFWEASAEALALRFRPDLDVRSDALLRQLGPLVRGPRDPAEALVELYEGVARGARERAMGGETDPAPLPLL